MIFVNSALMQDDIIKLLEENQFRFIKKSGLKLLFESEIENSESEAKRAKVLIKESAFGSALYFQTGIE